MKELLEKFEDYLLNNLPKIDTFHPHFENAMQDMLNKFQDMAKEQQEKSAQNLFTAKAGGGMVEISINGNSEVVDLKIDDSLLEDKDSLQILLISCMNDIIKQSEENKKRMAMNLMGNLGGLGNLGQK